MADAELLPRVLGWALLNFVWQGAVIGALAAAALRLLRGASPRWRYAVCALAMLSCLLAPLAHGAALLWSAPGALPVLVPEWLPEMRDLVAAWSLGVGLMSLRLAAGLLWVMRLRRRAEAASAVWQARLDALARPLKLNRAVALKVLPDLGSPVTVGWLKPVVLLPASLLSGMPAPLLEALLAHELAHVRRWDYLANLLQGAVEALLFFHPVVWWLGSRMRHEREQVADELAAAALDDPRRLAQALQALAELPDRSSPQLAPQLALSARGGLLFQRIERLLMKQQHQQQSPWKLALPALLLAGTSLLVQAGNAPAQAPLQTLRAAAAPAPALLRLPVNARHALVLEDGTGRVVMSKDADAQVPIASLTKLMTAMIVLDARLDPNETLRIEREDVDTIKHSASRLRVGAAMTRRDALTMALMSSENRAASALARHYPGGQEAFVRAMQAKARSLGLTRTAFADPTGLSPANQSTAAEVARIAAAAARYPEIARMSSGDAARVPVNGKPRALHNTNPLVGAKGWDIQLSKTGFSNEAGRCLAMRMASGGRQYTVVLLDADDPARRTQDAARIRHSLARLPA